MFMFLFLSLSRSADLNGLIDKVQALTEEVDALTKLVQLQKRSLYSNYHYTPYSQSSSYFKQPYSHRKNSCSPALSCYIALGSAFAPRSRVGAFNKKHYNQQNILRAAHSPYKYNFTGMLY